MVFLEGRQKGWYNELGRVLEYGALHESIQFLLEVILGRVRDKVFVKLIADSQQIAYIIN